MEIIGHNSVNIHQIPIKFGSEICRNKPFKYTKFHLDQSTRLHCMADFVKCAKRSSKRNKQRRNTRTLAAHTLEMFREIFFNLDGM